MMKRLTNKKTRISMRVQGWKNGKRILNASMRVPAAFIRRIEASPATAFKVKIVYGRAMTNKNKIEDIVNEVEGNKKEVITAVKVFVSKPELDATEKYWDFI